METGGLTLQSPRGRNAAPDQAALDESIEEAVTRHPDAYFVLGWYLLTQMPGI